MTHVNVHLTWLKCQNILGSKHKHITTEHTVIVIKIVMSSSNVT